MAKLTLNTIGSRYGSIDALNANNDLVEAALENTLSRDGTGPNNMEVALDMDSNSILNVDTVYTDVVRTDDLYINNVLVVPSNLAQATNASAVQYTPSGAGATVTTVQAKLRQTISVTDFGADGTLANDNAAFVAACASGRHVIVPNIGTDYNLSGTFTFATGTTLEFQGNPIVNLTLTSENVTYTGDRGFWFPGGSSHCAILGTVTINAQSLVSPLDGSQCNVFSFGKYVYGAGVDATISKNHTINGNIVVNGVQIGNLKTVGVYGWTEDVLIKGITQTGDNNFCFVCHWGQNISYAQRATTPLSTLPTKTWHPTNIVFEDCVSNSTWPNSNAFTVSAGGRLTFTRCRSVNTPEAFNLFAGDLGFTYAQNLGNTPFPQLVLENCIASGASNYTISADFQTNPTGIFENAILWTSADSNKGGTIVVRDFTSYLPNADCAGIALTAINNAIFENVELYDTGSTNTNKIFQAYGCRYVNVDSSSKFVSNFGMLVRNCNTVMLNGDNEIRVPAPNSANYGISVSADFETTTIVNTIAVGATSLVLATTTSVIGAGGIIRYNDGVTNWEIPMLSSSFSGKTNQTINIDPSPVAISAGATLTVIKTVDNLVVNGVHKNFASHVRATGSATAKIGSLTIGSNFVGLRSGVYGIEASEVDKLIVCPGAFFDYGGQRTTTTDTREILINADTSNFVISGAIFGRNNSRIRYLIEVDDGASNGVIEGCVFQSVSATTSNAAAIYKSAATNVQIYNNATISTVPLIYPLTPTSYTIAAGVITIENSQYPRLYTIDTEGAAATDDLDTINGGFEAQIIVLADVNSARDITVKDGTGNLKLAGDFTLSNQEDTITLVKRGTSWYEVSRSDNT
jgi:hypothetical protein